MKFIMTVLCSYCPDCNRGKYGEFPRKTHTLFTWIIAASLDILLENYISSNKIVSALTGIMLNRCCDYNISYIILDNVNSGASRLPVLYLQFVAVILLP